MANVLCTWELGGGMAHYVNLLPLVAGLSQRGHNVYVALRDLSRAHTLFGQFGVRFLQAPIRTRQAPYYITPPRTFAHVLHNSGFGDLAELTGLTEAWRSLYDHVQPDLIVFDHSPTALLASHGYAARRALIGTGFFCPLDEYPMPDLRSWLPPDAERLRRDEDRLLQNTNRRLADWKQAPFDRLAQLYAQVDEHFLTTFAELDNCPQRPGATYWGSWPHVQGVAPLWPQADGPKIFAYLKPFESLGSLLNILGELAHPTIVVGDGISRQLQQQHQSKTLQFTQETLDLSAVGKQCDLAILNGGHGTTVSMLLAGKPTFQIPIYLEAHLNSIAVMRLGAGLIATTDKAEQIAVRLLAMLSTDRFAKAARKFAERYADFNPSKQIDAIVTRADELARGSTN